MKAGDRVRLKAVFEDTMEYDVAEVYDKEGETLARLFPSCGGFMCAAAIDNLEIVK